MQDIILAILSIVSSIFVVCILIGLGWYIVWISFLSRFRFIRELIGGMTENSSVTELKTSRNKGKRTRRD